MNKSRRGISVFVAVISTVAAFSVGIGGASAGRSPDSVLAAQAGTTTVNALVNGSAEQGTSTTPTGWVKYTSSASAARDSVQFHGGRHSLKMVVQAGGSATWREAIWAAPNALYRLTGWVKTSGISGKSRGAEISANADWSTPVNSAAWTFVSVLGRSYGNGGISVNLYLDAKGTAWFDDLQLAQVLPTSVHPSWKVLVLIYPKTDVRITDDTGTHHLVGTLTAQQQQQFATITRTFVQTDIPALSSGNSFPSVTVRFPSRPLSELENLGDSGWWPPPSATAPERSPGYDAVMVIWQYVLTDTATGKVRDVAGAGGLAQDTGLAQTYLAIIAHPAYADGARNVYKHEFGHSILFYYAATGTTAAPTVTNHAVAGQYVHCPTGTQYVWQDESLEAPIPNSIYNNASGFTHDYYSGTTAEAGAPSVCLGIRPWAWAHGGPVSMPARTLALSARGVQQTVADTRAAGGVNASDAQRLDALLATAAGSLDAAAYVDARKALTSFVALAKSLGTAGRLKGWDATVLQNDGQVILAQLPGSTGAVPPMQVNGAVTGRIAAFPKP